VRNGGKGWLLVAALLVTAAVPFLPSAAHAQYGEKKRIDPKAPYWLGADFLWLRTKEDNYSAFFGKSTYLGRLRLGLNVAPLTDALLIAGFGRPSANTWATNQPDGIPVGAPGSNPTVRTLNVEKLYLFPIEAGLRFRGQWMRDQILVPYVEGGPAAWVFHDDFGQTGKGKVTGVKYGLWGAAGVMFDLIDLDSGAKRSLRADGYENFYLFSNIQYAWIDNFGGKGLDLSGVRYNFGLELRWRD